MTQPISATYTIDHWMTDAANEMRAKGWTTANADVCQHRYVSIEEAEAKIRDAYAEGALDETRRHPPQATAPEAREANPVCECGHTYTSHWSQGNHVCLAEDCSCGTFRSATATAPNDAAVGESGRLVAWAAEERTDGDDSYAACLFCGAIEQTRAFDNDIEFYIDHAPDCLHLWAVAQLAASPRPEAETLTDKEAELSADLFEALVDVELSRDDIINMMQQRNTAITERDAAREALATAVTDSANWRAIAKANSSMADMCPIWKARADKAETERDAYRDELNKHMGFLLAHGMVQGEIVPVPQPAAPTQKREV